MAVSSHTKFNLLVLVIVINGLCLVNGTEYIVWITHDGPIVQGATVTFQAELYRSDGSRPEGKFKFQWADNTIERHTAEYETHEPRSTWNVSYPANKFYPGEYEVQVNVDKWFVVFFEGICSRRTTFNITELLNGRLELVQGNPIKSIYVSNASLVQHRIALSKPDSDFLMNATQVITYWFVDCTYYGQSDDFAFNYTYKTVGANYSVEALVVASFEPLTTPAPTTTTTPSTTTTSSTTTTTSTTPPPQSSTSASNASSSSTTLIASVVNTRNSSRVLSNFKGPMSNQTSPLNVPYVCLNTSIIPPDPKKTYGYFHRQLSAKSPVHNISIKGTNWLQQYELLNLQVLCDGSGLFKTCHYLRGADYNVTGQETCPRDKIKIEEHCNFNVSKYYSSENYTMIVIIGNDVSKVVYPVKVILYKVQKHAQLSVIVVPVVCSLVAVILIVFGVAYYLQRRKRFTVEVADFDFGQGGGDLEYKTFRERLRESVINSFNRDFGVDGDGNVWSPSRKYGSMQ